MEESKKYIEETIGLIPETGCPRQVRILLNTFFIRPRIKTLSNYGLMAVAFSKPDQHLLSFYELFDRLASQKIEFKNLLILMQTLREVRETGKIWSMYCCSIEELDCQIKTGDPVKIIEGISIAYKDYGLSRRIIAQIEGILAVRPDGLEIGKQLLSAIPDFNLDYITRINQARKNID
jgi:hypothetical protein